MKRIFTANASRDPAAAREAAIEHVRSAWNAAQRVYLDEKRPVVKTQTKSAALKFRDDRRPARSKARR
jgi:hypothetical protein